MYGPGLLRYLRDNLPPQQFEQIRVALPPGPPFVGGSNLVIMKHMTSIHRLQVIKLIAHLTSPPVQQEYAQLIGALPARSDVFNTEPWSTNPLLQMFASALHQGRSLPVTTLWSVISDRMDQIFAEVWSVIQANPNENLEQVIVPRMQQLAQRIDVMLE
jgi:ABC-type glycerol-3-phosphate transport system substrate-binding protein